MVEALKTAPGDGAQTDGLVTGALLDLLGTILNAMSAPVFVVDGDNRISFVNSAAEQFFASSFAALRGQALDQLLPGDSPLFGLLREVRARGHDWVGSRILRFDRAFLRGWLESRH